MQPVEVNSQYVTNLQNDMIEWVKGEDSLTIPQFLEWKGIGYPALKYIIHHYPEVANTFEVIKAILCNKWFNMAMTKDKLPTHRSKMLGRYVRWYDSHVLDMEEESKKRITEVETKTHLQYLAESYARSDLTEPYKEIYDDNVNKRGDSKKAKQL